MKISIENTETSGNVTLRCRDALPFLRLIMIKETESMIRYFSEERCFQIVRHRGLLF